MRSSKFGVLFASTETCPTRLPSAEGKCHTFQYDGSSGTEEWAGVVWQYPLYNWGTEGGVCFATEPTAVSFYVRGTAGGEIVSFSTGSSGATLSDLVLTTEWQLVQLELDGVDAVDGKWQGFAWSALSLNGSIEFYVDDIRWIAK